MHKAGVTEDVVLAVINSVLAVPPTGYTQPCWAPLPSLPAPVAPPPYLPQQPLLALAPPPPAPAALPPPPQAAGSSIHSGHWSCPAFWWSPPRQGLCSLSHATRGHILHLTGSLAVSEQAGSVHTLHRKPHPSPSLVSEMLSRALLEIGANITSFSGASGGTCRLAIAVEARVPEHILWMQSGRAQDCVARRCVRLTNPDSLHDTWRAFHP